MNLRDESVETYAVNYLTNRYDNDQGEDIVCEYDDAGNTTVDPNGYQYTYDYENRIIEIKDKVSISIAEYAYDALGRRIQVYDKIADAKIQYYYNDKWQVLKETDDEGYGAGILFDIESLGALLSMSECLFSWELITELLEVAVAISEGMDMYRREIR